MDRLTPPVCRSELTPLSLLERSAAVFPDKEAIAYRDRRITYRQFAAGATRLARALRASGIGKGDRVAYLMPNLPEMLVAHFGVPLAGAVLVAPDEKWGERPKGFVVRKPGHEVSPQDLIEHVRQRLAHFKAPRGIEFLDALPKTSTGKIQKFELREREWAGYAARIKG